LEESHDSDDELDCVTEGGIEETSQCRAELESCLLCSITEELEIGQALGDAKVSGLHR
jgi:hypothetical protein